MDIQNKTVKTIQYGDVISVQIHIYLLWNLYKKRSRIDGKYHAILYEHYFYQVVVS